LLTILFLKRFSTPSFWRVVLLTPVTLLLLVIPLFNPLSAPTKLYNMFAGNEWPFGIAVLVWGLAAPAILCWITGIDRTFRGEMTLAQDVRHNKAGSGVGSAG
jgi:hypothetical protein